MEEPFKKVVCQIFINWTALKLAVDHSMGGPNSKQVATDFMNYVVQYCIYEHHVDLESIQNVLEDIMDEEFETICEDESPRQIAYLLFNFLNLLKQGKNEECEVEFQKLPNVNPDWLTQLNVGGQNDSSESSESDSQDAPMDEDSWVEVKGRRKR